MSIQKKLMVTISTFTFLILSLNVIFSYINTQNVNKAHLEQQIDTISKQLYISLKLIEDTNEALEEEMARSLYSSAKIVEQLLPPSYVDITDQQLVEVADMLNISTITLWKKDENGELLSILSSNPDELYLRSKTWDYWNTAMLELYHMQPVSITNGNTYPNFYSGPMNFSVSDASKIAKFGYYYSNNTDYLINTIVEAEQIYDDGYLEKKQEIVTSIVEHVEALEEITAINPEFFGKEKILKMKDGKLVHNLDVRDIMFGEYNYSNGKVDVQTAQESISTLKSLSTSFKIGNTTYTRVFIPIEAKTPYIISFVFNEDMMMKKTVEQLIDHISISILLFLLTILVTSIMSKKLVEPVLLISEKVKQIAQQNFDFPLQVRRKDELGVLTTHVNEMSERLQNYTTELKLSANQLAQAEHQLKSIIALANDPIVMMTTDYKFYHVNNAFTQLFGYTLGELQEVTLPQLHTSEEANSTAILNRIVADGFVANEELVLKTSSGHIKHISLALSPIHDTHERCIGLAGIMHDMTTHHDKKQLLLQNEKLSAISQLSASIAHEFRNPLTTLHGFLKLSEQRGQLSPHYIPMLIQELEHMELILDQFLTMTKPQVYTYNSIHVDELLESTIQFLQSSGKLTNIEIVWDIMQRPTVIQADQKFLRQAFINIFINSIEAIHDEGKICITVTQHSHHATIVINDNGKGIQPENLSKIFEPFYTNKDYGTGLGLLVTQQIIIAHQGEISYESEVGKGTTVTISFPTKTKN